jgi:hypothetical protein
MGAWDDEDAAQVAQRPDAGAAGEDDVTASDAAGALSVGAYAALLRATATATSSTTSTTAVVPAPAPAPPAGKSATAGPAVDPAASTGGGGGSTASVSVASGAASCTQPLVEYTSDEEGV